MTDSNFSKYLRLAWEDYEKSGGLIDWEKHDVLCSYVLGDFLLCSKHWSEAEFVYIPVHVEILDHWILLVVDISLRSIVIYDSLKGRPSHDELVDKKCSMVAKYLPHLLQAVGGFDGKLDIQKGIQPLSFRLYESNPQQSNGLVNDVKLTFLKFSNKLYLEHVSRPSSAQVKDRLTHGQSEGSWSRSRITSPMFKVKDNLTFGHVSLDHGRDCDMFIIKYTEFLMSDKSVSKVTTERMEYFCHKLVCELYNHGLRKYEEYVETNRDE
ncbi:Ulp1 protease family, C-terminal catalytic domain containing protein [Trema orientale]|uniref:Ulp1 protease family, C-terminal catalytic domain containing protein n=1 Tax=Trema orientale TaxID=63057 RepID=A0A2P5DTE1_TREOI|nr:Ulp1 protease family, C-terminal catalytic domain containing protein [Trema orientale]